MRTDHDVPTNMKVLVGIENRIAIDIGAGTYQQLVSSPGPTRNKYNSLIQCNMLFKRYVGPTPSDGYPTQPYITLDIRAKGTIINITASGRQPEPEAMDKLKERPHQQAHDIMIE
jgi:hypothetical protein